MYHPARLNTSPPSHVKAVKLMKGQKATCKAIVKTVYRIPTLLARKKKLLNFSGEDALPCYTMQAYITYMNGL